MTQEPRLETLHNEVRAADLLHDRARKMLVDAVRAAAKSGLSQREIAQAAGRSQPEISRLLRFQGKSLLGKKIRKHRNEILRIAKTHGARELKVFGSVAEESDTHSSDVDFLATFDEGVDLVDMARLESELRNLLGVNVDVVQEKSLRSFLRDRVLSEAVPL